MGTRGDLRANPGAYAAPVGFPALVAEAPEIVVLAVGVTERIRQIVDETGLRETARRAGISHSTLSRTLAGEIWPSFVTIASIEEAFEVRLWR